MLNRLELHGFKSFQRNTGIPFYPGMTAIVGQNGTGKSNIVEAISFVLGKRSSNLRAESLTQLIFNGGQGRPPSQYAMVSLHLNNSDGRFNSFLENAESPEEVSISRKITRAGTAVYKFMGRNCKRELIDQILGVANLEWDEYTIVGQGLITDLVKRSPRERRKVIDEVAGVASFDEKKGRALNELVQVDEKLKLQFMLLEDRMERRRQLRRQSEVAEKFIELDEKRGVLEKITLQQNRQELEDRLESELSTHGKFAEKRTELENKLQKVDESIDGKHDEIQKMEEELLKGADVEEIRELEQMKATLQTKEKEREFLHKEYAHLKDFIRASDTSETGNRAVDDVINANIPGVKGSFISLINYSNKYATAMSVALGGHAYDIITNSKDTAITCINRAKKAGLGRIRVLPLSELVPPHPNHRTAQAEKSPGIIGRAIDLIKVPADISTAAKFVLRDTLIAEDLESLRNIRGVRAVTLDGEELTPGGAMSGGRVKRMLRKSAANIEKERRLKEIKGEVAELENDVEVLRNAIEQKEKSAAQNDTLTQQTKETREKEKREIEILREERKLLYADLMKFGTEVSKLELQIQHVRAELNTLPEPSEKISVPDEFKEKTAEELKKELNSTIRNLNALGPVNPSAKEEFTEFEKEFVEREEKVKKIQEEKAEIELLIEEIERRKKEKFESILEDISERFNRHFQTLFEGGNALLELQEPHDITSGLLIRAHPPSKKPHLIDALSGGEKTLTAIAFIFAVQDIRPSPFYVMDEIDAALDSPNSARLSRLLKSYSAQTQLIIISHNEETVRNAERAYGISMRSGVSMIRSINLLPEQTEA